MQLFRVNIFLILLSLNELRVEGQCYQTIYAAGKFKRPSGSLFSPKCPDNYQLSTLSSLVCYPKCNTEHAPYGPLCYLKECRGAYKYSCNLPLLCAQLLLVPGIGPVAAAICSSKGLLCTLNRSQCVKMNKEISFASMLVLKNLASFIATDGEFFEKIKN